MVPLHIFWCTFYHLELNYQQKVKVNLEKVLSLNLNAFDQSVREWSVVIQRGRGVIQKRAIKRIRTASCNGTTISLTAQSQKCYNEKQK